MRHIVAVFQLLIKYCSCNFLLAGFARENRKKYYSGPPKTGQ